MKGIRMRVGLLVLFIALRINGSSNTRVSYHFPKWIPVC